MAGADTARRATRGLGVVLVTLGVVVTLRLGYELWGTSVVEARAQHDASAQLDRAWATGASATPAVAVGGPVARLRIPALGPDWSAVLLEGTDRDVLARGPGHYVGTAQPGRPGNVGIAGHRVGRGAPFDGLGSLSSCDEVVVETRDAALTYRVLPFADEVTGWATARGSTPACAGVPVPAGDYAGVVGREIVTPDRVDVLAAVPGRPGVEPGRPMSLLTLTTCHPRFSARERMVVHAVLVGSAPTPGATGRAGAPG